MKSHDLSKKLISHFMYLELTRKKSLKLLNSNDIVRRDIELIYKGLFFDIYTSFENFIEDLFLGLLRKSIEHPSSKFKLNVEFNKRYMVKTNNGNVTKKVAFEKHFIMELTGRRFLDWLPYRHTTVRADLFFKDGYPFSILTNSEVDYIYKLSLVRNVLAHDSEKSRRLYESKVINGLLLTSNEARPMGYLLSRVAGRTRLEEIVHTLSIIANKLTSK